MRLLVSFEWKPLLLFRRYVAIDHEMGGERGREIDLPLLGFRTLVHGNRSRALLVRPLRLAVMGCKHGSPGLVELADEGLCGDPAGEIAGRTDGRPVLRLAGLRFHPAKLLPQEG